MVVIATAAAAIAATVAAAGFQGKKGHGEVYIMGSSILTSANAARLRGPCYTQRGQTAGWRCPQDEGTFCPLALEKPQPAQWVYSDLCLLICWHRSKQSQKVKVGE